MDVDDAVVDAHMHPVSLVFLDPEREARFVNFLYVTSGFYGGIVYQLLTAVFPPAMWIYWYGMRQGWDVGMFTEPVWAPMIFSFVVITISTIVILMKRFVQYREVACMCTVLSAYPIFYIVWIFGMGDGWHLMTVFIFYGSLLALYLPQARFSRIAVPFLLYPIPTIAIGTAITPSYWDTYSHMEILMWAAFIIPPLSFWPFERENRRSFYRVEKGEEAIAAIEAKAARTRSMIVSFFAHTPTRDFLASGGSTLVRQRQYSDTAMVVTDLAGFTAWTSTIDAVTASEHLGMMFESLDTHSERYGVEKISTVGDCFQGAIFPPSGCSGASASNNAKAAMAMLEFAQASLGTFTQLQVRVGVHMGSVTAAFIGRSPPKFDLFGADWEVTKTLESDGVAGRVHASHSIVATAAPLGGPSGDVQETPTGVVFKVVRVADPVLGERKAPVAVDMCSSTSNSSTAEDQALTQSSSDTKADFTEEEIRSVCKALMRLGRAKREPQQSHGRHRRWSLSSHQSQQSSLSAGKYVPSAIPPDANRGDTSEGTTPQTTSIPTPTTRSVEVAGIGGEDEHDGDIDIDSAATLTWRLVYQDPTDERLYQDSVRRSGFVGRALSIAILIEVVFLSFHSLVGCVHTDRNRLLVTLSSLVFGIFSVWELRGLNTRFRPVTTLIAFVAVPTLIGFSDNSCGPTARVYFQNNVFALMMNGIYALNFMIPVPLLGRLAIIFGLGAWCFAFVLMRRYGFGDEYIVIDITLLVMPTFFCLISLSTDYMMRSAFTANRKLKMTRRRDRAGLQLLASTAVDVMVPAFVSERLTSVKEQDQRDAERLPDEDSANEGVLLDRTKGATQTWEFDNITVMFVSVDVEGDGADDIIITALNDTFTKLETILVSHGVQKIKTVGNTLMCAHGMVSERDPTFVQMHVAAQMAQRVLQNEPVIRFRVGIHVGPAFGAVMGTSSILFDVFGDSVNMASRMASTATENTVQVSEAVHARCSQHPMFRFSKNDDVLIKGKGSVPTYTVLL